MALMTDKERRPGDAELRKLISVCERESPNQHAFGSCALQRRMAEELLELRALLSSALSSANWLWEGGYIDDAGDDEDCPHDDTCECPSISHINMLFCALEGRPEVRSTRNQLAEALETITATPSASPPPAPAPLPRQSPARAPRARPLRGSGRGDDDDGV